MAAGTGSAARLTIDLFADDVRVTGVARGLLDHGEHRPAKGVGLPLGASGASASDLKYALAMASARRHRQRHNAAAMRVETGSRPYQITEDRHARPALDLAHDA